MERKRIEWVDIFKAFAIILVVVGHSTGLFNNYIYQVHMAAFFFISGYTENLINRTTFETFNNKFYRLVLPLIVMFIAMLLITTFLNHVGMYNVFFQDSFIGFYRSLREFFSGRIYINWLGATWFLGTLFGIILIQKIIHSIIRDNTNLIYMIISFLLFVLGYFMALNNIQLNISIISFDLVLIGQFYFMIGNLCKNKEWISKFLSNRILRVITFPLTIFLMWYFGNVYPVTVDYPSRRFGFWLIDAIVAINGIIFLCILSNEISKIRIQKIKKVFVLIGKNTLGILFLHLLNFKVSYLLLAMFKIVPFTYMNTFVPTTEIGNRYWWMISSVSMVISIGIWQLIIKSKFGYNLLGNNKIIIEKINIVLMKKLHIKKCTEEKYVDSNNRILRMQVNKMKKYIISNKIIVAAILILVILIMSPMMIQGIIINDELQARFWSMQGFKSFFIHFFNSWKVQGRVIMAVTSTVSMYLSFITSNREIFRIFSIIGILLNVSLFGVFLYKLFRNKMFCIFTVMSILIFLPITFEPVAPNAFVNLFSMPFSFLLISLILFINFMEKSDRKSIIISCISLYIALTGYEMFIMFTPLYLLIVLYKVSKNDVSLKKLILKLVWPAITAGIYLIMYFSLRKLMPSNYEGNQIGFTLQGFVNIVKQLFESSIPGYFLFNKKYEYLFNKYFSNEYELLKMRIILILIFYIGILMYVFKVGKMIKKDNKGFWHDFAVVLSGLIFTIIPTFPNAMSKMYQGNVNAENFIALPVTYFTYFFMVFTICYILWLILKSANKKIIYILVTILLGVYSIPIQAMNDAFSRVQSKDYNRMITIEQFLETNMIKNLNNNSILSPDLYTQKDALFIQDGYWKDFSKINGLNLDISEKNEGQKISIDYPNDEYFQINAGEFIIILSKESLNDKIMPIKIQNTKLYQGALLKDSIKDHQFYIYTLKNNKGEVLQENDENPLKDFISTSGNTLETSEKLSGYYNDGWLEKESEFKIKVGEQGKIIIQGYYPFEIADNLTGIIYINDVPHDFKITQENFSLEFSAPKNTIDSVKIECNFDRQASESDLRRIAFVLKGLDGK